MKLILIDLDNMKVLKLAEGKDALTRLEYWADILIPKGEFYICGDTKKDLATFTHLEIKILYRNLRGNDAMGNDYGRTLALVHEILMDMIVDSSAISELWEKLGRPLSKQTCLPVKEKEQRESKPISILPIRPKKGSLTGRVWEAADWLYSQQEPKEINCKELRNMVIKTCVDNGVNSSTATTQYAKWKKVLISSC